MKAGEYQQIAFITAQVARALAWLELVTDEDGGVHRWYREDTGNRGNVSFEITGYALHLFTWLAKTVPNDRFAERADLHARFLGKWIISSGDMLPSYEPGSIKSYFFDCGIVARALRFYGNEQGEALAETMVRFHNVDGFIQAISTINGFEVNEPKQWWSSRPGLYQLKAALAWSGLQWHTHFSNLLNSSITIADMPDSDEAAFDTLHPLAYYVEGLSLHRHVHREQIQRARLASYLKQSTYYRTDATAQYIRLAIMAGLEPADQLGRLKLLQRSSGGFAFSNRPGESFISSHATVFAIQALIMAEIGPTPELGIYQIV